MNTGLTRRVLRSLLFDLVLAWIRSAALIVLLIVACGFVGGFVGRPFGIGGAFTSVVLGWLALWALFLYVLNVRRDIALRDAALRRLGVDERP